MKKKKTEEGSFSSQHGSYADVREQQGNDVPSPQTSFATEPVSDHRHVPAPAESTSTPTMNSVRKHSESGWNRRD